MFKRDFAGASETAKAAITDLTEVVTGNVVETVEMEKAITKVTDKIKEYAKSTLDSAKSIVTLRKESELAQVQVQGLIEEYDRQAEKLRQVRDDETKTFEERIAANEELGRVLKEQEEEMLKLVDIQIKAAQADVDKNNSLENQIALQEALNEKKAVDRPREGSKAWDLLAEKNKFDLVLHDVVKELWDEQEQLLGPSYPQGYRQIKQTCCKCNPPTYPPGGFECPK